MEENNEFNEMIEQVMQGILHDLSQEQWSGPVAALKREHELIRQAAATNIQQIENVNRMIDEHLDALVALSDEQSPEFWKALENFRVLATTADETIRELHELEDHLRTWTRPYFDGVCNAYRDQAKTLDDFKA